MRIIYETNHIPEPGKYKDAIVEDDSTDKKWLYDSCGTYSLIDDPAAIEDTDVDSFNGRNGTVMPLAGDYTASQVTNVPSGLLSATNVQAAVDELSSEKVAKGDLVVNVKDFGAVGDGVADDTAAIQAAINNTSHDRVYFPAGTYNVSSPIYLRGREALFGDMNRKTTIQKTTTTPGIGSDISPTSAVVDSYVKNALFIIKSGGGYAYEVSISDMRLKGLDYTTDYGIYAPRTAKLLLSNLEIVNFRYGFLTHDSWMSKFTNVAIDCGTRVDLMGSNYGWAVPTYAFAWLDDGSGLTTGTSLHMDKCWATNAHYAFSYYKLLYSSMTSCAAEQISSSCYDFIGSMITLNSCGIEKAKATANIINLNSGRYTFNSCSWSYAFGVDDPTTAGISLKNTAFASMSNCQFVDFTDPAASMNVYLDSTSTVTMLNTMHPVNGASTPFMSKSFVTQGLKTIRSGQLVKQLAQLAIPANAGSFYNGFVLENSGSADAYAIGIGTGSVLTINRHDGVNTYESLLNLNRFRHLSLGASYGTHSLTIPYDGSGIADYLTPNQTTDYERFRADWVNGVYTMDVEAIGSGVLPSIAIKHVVNPTSAQDVATKYYVDTQVAAVEGSDVDSFNSRTGTVMPANGDYTATQVTNTPAGNIAATTVQAALNELDTEKAVNTAVVHLAGAETITGAKTFSTTLTTSSDAIIGGRIGTIGASPSAVMDVGASGTTRASLRIRSGVAPTSPNDGDIWYDGANLYMRIGGVTKTFTLV